MSQAIIEMNNVTFSYSLDEGQKRALNEISLTIEEGEWVAIIGPNGSGKSTLVKTLNGILVPQQGTIEIDSLPLNEENIWTIRELVGMVFQNPDNQFVGSTVEDDVAFGLENKGIPRQEMVPIVQSALETVGMAKFADREPSSLSGGQKQRVAIAGILALQPKVLVMDESTSMLDPSARKEILQTVRQVKQKNNLTVISITHDIDEAAEASRILVMKDGRLVDDGTPQKIFSKGEELIELGLDLPFAERLKLSLQNSGVEVPDHYMTEDELRQWLWIFN